MSGHDRFSFDPENPPQRVSRWIKRLERTMAAAPKDVWLFAANGTLYVMAKSPHDERVLDGLGGMDQAATVGGAIGGPEIDGGDW
jgi:hypothetical protein